MSSNLSQRYTGKNEQRHIKRLLTNCSVWTFFGSRFEQSVITRQGNVNTGWIFEHSKELLWVLSGVITALGFYFTKGLCVLEILTEIFMNGIQWSETYWKTIFREGMCGWWALGGLRQCPIFVYFEHFHSKIKILQIKLKFPLTPPNPSTWRNF